METIRVAGDAGLVTITLDRPEKKKAVDASIWKALDHAVGEVAANPDDRALILSGAGGSSSAGANLSRNKTGRGLTGGLLQPIVQEMRIVGAIILRLQRLPKPPLAKVDGVCVGESLGLALGLSKRLLDASSSVTLAQALEDEARSHHITHASKDVREGITAFLERRREPRFSGC